MHEECGVFGIWSPFRKNVAQDIYLGLYALQHRGQESCGIAVSCNGVFQHSLAYLSVDAARRLGGVSARFCCDGCFTGRYPIDIPEDQGKSKFETPINGNHE